MKNEKGREILRKIIEGSPLTNMLKFQPPPHVPPKSGFSRSRTIDYMKTIKQKLFLSEFFINTVLIVFRRCEDRARQSLISLENI